MDACWKGKLKREEKFVKHGKEADNMLAFKRIHQEYIILSLTLTDPDSAGQNRV